MSEWINKEMNEGMNEWKILKKLKYVHSLTTPMHILKFELAIFKILALKFI